MQAIELELDEEEDGPVYQWFYEHQPLKHTSFVNGPSYRRWKLPLPIMAVLYRLAGQLLSDFVDRCVALCCIVTVVLVLMRVA
jgi:pre-mRNA-processing factor 8